MQSHTRGRVGILARWMARGRGGGGALSVVPGWFLSQQSRPSLILYWAVLDTQLFHLIALDSVLMLYSVMSFRDASVT